MGWKGKEFSVEVRNFIIILYKVNRNVLNLLRILGILWFIVKSIIKKFK